MSSKEWDTFFKLLAKIVHYPGKSADQKADLVQSEAEDRSSVSDLCEFTSWEFDSEESDE